MKLYEIDEAILDCIDQDTGEVLDIDRLNALQMERDAKIRNVGLWYKNLKSDVAALKAEEDAFKTRRQSAEKRLEGLKGWLAYATDGQPFETEDKAVTIKTVRNGGPLPVKYNEAIDIKDIPETFRKVEYSYDTDAIKKALDSGEVLGFAEYGERGTHITIK